MTRQELNDIADRLKAYAIKIGLTDDYNAVITWANEGTSVYLTFGSPQRKIRVSDHTAAYRCSISVDPEGLTEEQAIAWLNAERADELEDDD